VLIPSDILLSEILSVTSNNQKLSFKVSAKDEFLVKYSKIQKQEATEKEHKNEVSASVSLKFLEKNRPIVGIEFIFDGIKMKTDVKGIVKVPRGALGKLKTNPYIIEKIDSTSASNFVISLKKAEPIEGDFNDVITQLEQQKQAVVVQNAAIYNKISEINDRLKNNKNLSEDERKQLRGSVLRLEGQLNENNRAFEDAQKKTSALLTMVKNAIEQKDSVSQAANVRIKQIEEENEQEKAESRRTLIFISSIAIVLAIASFAFFNILRKVNKQKAEITAQANNLTQLNDLIVSKNEKITDSIRYAQTIQQAILPDDERMAAISKESFVLYKPKDIVSGDFYWVSDTNKQKDVFIACVDCTGHGVSGAFMSLIANTLLNQIVNQEGISDTATILEMLNSGIRKSLKQEQKVNKDGMDLSICKISHTENGTKIYFTGAKRPLWIVRNNTKIVEVFKGDLKSIGGDQRKNREFTVQAIDVFEGDMLYMMTDGFVDQCNVTKEKFGTKQLLELIPQIASKALYLQKNDLQNALASHQASEEQRDDISIIGLRF
jgi:serine phosphatase RsbU (regulator of sigma subunit)